MQTLLGTGISQSGRVLRDFVYLGFNESADHRPVYDGLLLQIPGGRRSYTNARFAQPARNPGPNSDDLYPVDQFPMAYATSTDAQTGRTEVVGELKLKISGCINACGHHHAGHIGILGVDKKGVENYQLSLGGSEAEDVSLAKITGPGFDEDGVIAAVEKVTDVYLATRADGERFLDTYRRIGMEPFKEALYG